MKQNVLLTHSILWNNTNWLPKTLQCYIPYRLTVYPYLSSSNSLRHVQEKTTPIPHYINASLVLLNSFCLINAEKESSLALQGGHCSFIWDSKCPPSIYPVINYISHQHHEDRKTNLDLQLHIADHNLKQDVALLYAIMQGLNCKNAFLFPLCHRQCEVG